MAEVDKVTFELLKNSLTGIADEMTLTMMRTARSNNVRDAMDFATAICDAQGRMVAQGICNPALLGAIPDAMRYVLDKYGDDVQPGDVFISNDAYSGGQHLTDIFLFKPFFSGGVLVAYNTIVSDHGDIGGVSAGGRAVTSTEIFQEGLRIPPLKFIEAGKPVEAIREIIRTNVRVPDTVLGDLDAVMAAFFSAERLLSSTIDRFGLDAVMSYLPQVLAYSEQMARNVIASWPDGHYEFTDFLDDAVIIDTPVKIHVNIEVRGEQLHIDFTGSDAQVPAAINSPFASTTSLAYAAVRTLMPSEMVVNDGFFRTITITAPEGTIVRAKFPAAVAARGASSFRALDAILGALAQLVPSRIPAAGEGGNFAIRITSRNTSRPSWIMWDCLIGTWGARSDRDGIDGCANFAANLGNVPVEVIESEYPVRIVKYELRRNSGGAGEFRGGLGLTREWELLNGEANLVVRGDRIKFAPWGLEGGGPGQKSRSVLNSHAEAQILPGKMQRVLNHGERFMHEQAAGGGYGDPLKRDPEKVLWDWRNDKITAEHARSEYGVVIEEKSKSLDRAATGELRERLAAAKPG